ncbi:hypothetical protein GN958_ATG04584, partial [Phytophthora infestans]
FRLRVATLLDVVMSNLPSGSFHGGVSPLSSAMTFPRTPTSVNRLNRVKGRQGGLEQRVINMLSR